MEARRTNQARQRRALTQTLAFFNKYGKGAIERLINHQTNHHAQFAPFIHLHKNGRYAHE